MKKLRLLLDSVQVETFRVTPLSELAGTVDANEMTGTPNSCLRWTNCTDPTCNYATCPSAPPCPCSTT